MTYLGTIRPVLDRLAALAGIVLSSPILLLAAIAIILEDGKPVIFRQARTGADGETFTIFKFRSMPVGTPHLASADARALRPTRVGRFIRQTNIDELPQLFNILNGEMALIGPRPSLPTQHDVIAERVANGSIALKPGLTGLAQINGYDGMETAEKCAYDGRYLREAGPLLDLKILFGTVFYMLRRQPVV